MTSDEVESVQLEMIIYECDRYLKKCEIGTIKMDLKEAVEPLQAGKLVEMWRDLVPQLHVSIAYHLLFCILAG